MDDYKRMTENTSHGGIRYLGDNGLCVCYPELEIGRLTNVDKMAIRLNELELAVEDRRLVEVPPYNTLMFTIVDNEIKETKCVGAFITGGQVLAVMDTSGNTWIIGSEAFFDKKEATKVLKKTRND